MALYKIKNFEPRLYQQTIMASCARANCLVILPTGLGKTKTAIMTAVQRLNSFPKSKILFLTVTKPLVDQIFSEIKDCVEIDENKIVMFTGMVEPEKRQEQWKSAVFVISTPQCIQNDIITGKINLDEVSLLIADEAHNAVKDYAYTWIAQQYYKKAQFPRIVGLTASPGSDMEKIREVCENLFIEEIEARTDDSPDVAPYVKEIEMKWVEVELPPPFLEVQAYIKSFLKSRLASLKEGGILQRKNIDLRYVNKKDLLELQAELRGRVASGEKDPMLWNAISVLAEIMKIQHALELLETQGIAPLYKYLKRLQDDSTSSKVRAVKNIVRDVNFRSALIKTTTLHEQGIEHPKLVELQRIVEKELKKDKSIKMIIFNQYRDNAIDIREKINKIDGARAEIFVGQLKKEGSGLTQKEQRAIIDKFKSGELNILIATSIGEQGLDLPQVNLVIFYEPISSAIRHIQRRGRTGRHEEGRLIILVTKNTRDESYRWSAHHKEKSMYRNLDDIKKKIKLTSRQQPTLESYAPKEVKVKIIADHREKSSGVIKELADQGYSLQMEALDSADYLVSSRCAIELKTVQDFVDSIVDGRLLDQIRLLKETYERPLVLVEGAEDLFSVRNVHANAIRGMLATIAVSYGIPIIQTKNPRETAALIGIISKREQEETGRDFSMHSSKKPMSIKEQQEYIVSSLPGVGTALAKPLLEKFKSVKGVINAEEAELKTVELIGDKKAKKIKEIVDKDYQSL